MHICLLILVLVMLFGSEARAAGSNVFSKGPYVQDVAATTANVRVEVDPAAAVTLEVADGGAPGRIEHREAAAFHVFPLTGLSPRTLYHYTVTSAGTAKTATFTTAPPDNTSDPATFIVYGDNRTDDAAHTAIVRTMTAHPADFLVNTGDLVEHGGIPVMWQHFFDIEAPLLNTECLFATIGNHELADKEASLYLRYFGTLGQPGQPSALDPQSPNGALASPPLLHRTFRWGRIRIFTIAGMGEVGDEMHWLESALAAADQEPGLLYRIIVTHHGPWSSGPHGSNKKLQHANIVSMLHAHHVSMVVSGHDHIYERGEAEGIPYVVSGGGGAPLYDQTDKLPTTRVFDSVRHFVELRASTSGIKLSAVRTDGSVIDACSIGSEGGGWNCDTPGNNVTLDGSVGTSDGDPPREKPSDVAAKSGKSSCACSVTRFDAREEPHSYGEHGGHGTRRGHEEPQREGQPHAPGLVAVFGLFLLAARRYARPRC